MFSCPVGKAVSTSLPRTRRILVDSGGRTTRRTAVISLVQGSLDHITRRMEISGCHCVSILRAGGKGVLRADSRVDNGLPANCRGRVKGVLSTVLPTNSVANTPGSGAVRVVRRTRNCSHKFCAKIVNVCGGNRLGSTMVVHFLRGSNLKACFGTKKNVASGDSYDGRCRRILRGICLPFR